MAQADAEEAQKTLSRPGTARRLDLTSRGRTPAQTGRFATPERLPRRSQATPAAGLGPLRSQSAGTHLQSPQRQASGRQAGRLHAAGGSLIQGPWRAGSPRTPQASPPPSPLRGTHGRRISAQAPAAVAAAGRTGSQPQSYSAWQATTGQGSTRGRAVQSPLRTQSAEGGEKDISVMPWHASRDSRHCSAEACPDGPAWSRACRQHSTEVAGHCNLRMDRAGVLWQKQLAALM